MKPEVEAQNLLEELGISSLPVLPYEICQRLGIGYQEGPFSGFDGTLAVDPKGQFAYIGVNSLIKEPGRKNFTCAHELGHYCLHFDQQKGFICSKDNIETFKNKTPPLELQADKFAAELLMPKFIFQKLVRESDPGWDTIKEFANRGQTSLLATAIRYIDLTDHACALIICESCNIIWFRKSEEFAPNVQMGVRIVPPYTHAYAAFDGSTPPDNWDSIKADNWLSGRGINPDTEILEWTLPMNSYGQVLTFLWDEEGIEGWERDEYKDQYEDVVWEPPRFHRSKRKK